MIKECSTQNKEHIFAPNNLHTTDSTTLKYTHPFRSSYDQYSPKVSLYKYTTILDHA